MSTAIKRKRGRPRRDDSREISQFDLSLVQEYRSRTEFYDPNHPHYKNRQELEFSWASMARAMGNSVQLVKNRLIQLRNRYNLEKRRIEMLQHQYQDPTITSQWPLYEKLSFLGDHIRTRRTFSNTLPVHPKNQPPTSSESEEDDDGGKLSQSLPNGVGVLPPSITPVHHMVTRQHVISYNNENEDANNSNECKSKKKRTLEALQNQSTTISKGRVDSSNVVVNGIGSGGGIGGVGGGCIGGGAGGNGGEKFKAFGHFLASSLMEINEKDALRLIEKFTSDLVRSLMAEVKSPCDDTEILSTTPTNSNLNLSV